MVDTGYETGLSLVDPGREDMGRKGFCIYHQARNLMNRLICIVVLCAASFALRCLFSSVLHVIYVRSIARVDWGMCPGWLFSFHSSRVVVNI